MPEIPPETPPELPPETPPALPPGFPATPPRNGIRSQLNHAARTAARSVRRLPLPQRRRHQLGAKPGIHPDELSQLPSGPEPAVITCFDFGPGYAQATHVTDLEAFLRAHRPVECAVRWINVDGLTDMHAIQALARKYDLHPLAIEDVLHVHQRPKVEGYGGTNGELPRLFIVARMVQLVEGRLRSEQISIFLGRTTVLTFQEKDGDGDVWGPIRERLSKPGSRMSQNDASFLVYSLLDAVVDYCFPTLEHYSDELERIEDRVVAGDNRAIHDIHAIKHDLMLLRREIWPMRELINNLLRQEHVNISATTRIYLRDVYDHTVQVIDLVETYREVATGLADMWLSSMSNRMNEVMKVLTIIATIFIPITFLAGVYGMNFANMPELHQRWAYPMFWVICLGVAGGMLAWFKRRGWL